jgi:hypothetical protein
MRVLEAEMGDLAFGSLACTLGAGQQGDDAPHTERGVQGYVEAVNLLEVRLVSAGKQRLAGGLLPGGDCWLATTDHA